MGKKKKRIKELEQEVCVLKIVNAYLRAKVVPLEQRMKASSRVMAETNWKRYGFSERRF